MVYKFLDKKSAGGAVKSKNTIKPTVSWKTIQAIVHKYVLIL